MTDKYILNEQGEPVPEPDLLKWAAWFEKADRHVAKDLLPGGERVSTVFIGMDHSFSRVPCPPVLWETMIFGGAHDEYQERYSSREEALAGHARAVALAPTPSSEEAK